jgi:hypothetical protein
MAVPNMKYEMAEIDQDVARLKESRGRSRKAIFTDGKVRITTGGAGLDLGTRNKPLQ